MGLRINTNISAQYAIMNLDNTNNKLSQSLNRLSTGLRINKAADDAAGMTIADGLKFQSMNLGQAINNGNNGIKLIQIADMALQKSIDIVQTIAQKATQAANATEDSGSRAALQSDTNKLIEELNNIANTTSYKGVNLLDGTFTNKLIHIGAYMNQTLSIGAQRTNADSIGWVTRSTDKNNVEFENPAASQVTFNTTDNRLELNADDLTINGVNVAGYADGINKTQTLDAKTMVTAINNLKSMTGGVEAEATTTMTASAAVTAGSISAGSFFINGVDMGQINVVNGDADNALVDRINQYTDQTGVTASKNAQGQIVLTAQDGRNIAVKANTNVTGIVHLTDNETTVTGTSLGITSGTTAASIASAGTLYLNGVTITETAGETVTSLVNAINAANIAGVTAKGATVASLTISVDNGNDLNARNALSAVTDILENSSAHGMITLTGTGDITIGGKNPAVAGLKAGTISPNQNLSDVNVTTQSGAELAIKIAQSALSDLDKVRSNLGSVQNQIQATVENISVTQININGAESTIRDVNFAKESSNFSKLQILAQSGTYALAQSNAVQQNVLRLLQ